MAINICKTFMFSINTSYMDKQLNSYNNAALSFALTEHPFQIVGFAVQFGTFLFPRLEKIGFEGAHF